MTPKSEIQRLRAELELNIFDVPMNERVSAEIEEDTVEMVGELRRQLTIPIPIKLSPFHTSLPHRFFEPDIDIENLEVIAEMRLSDSRQVLLRLRWSVTSRVTDATPLARSG